MLGWLYTIVISSGETNKNVTVKFLKKPHGLRQLYASFFFAVLNSSTQNIQCSSRKDNGRKISHTRAKHVR